MTDLIQRLEAATEPSRKLDTEIYAKLSHFSVGNIAVDIGIEDDEHIRLFMADRSDRVLNLGSFKSPSFTESVDAALTLIPPGWDVRESDSNGGLWRVVLGRGDDNHPSYREVWSWPGDRDRGIFHRKSLALAITIAALKAKGL